MTGPELVLDIAVILGFLIDVMDQDANGRSRRLPLENTRKNLNFILLLGWITPIEHVRLWALLPLLLWLLGIVGMLLLRPMPLPMVARRVDAALNLRERLATALELENLTEHGDLDDEQHADAEQTAAGLSPKQIPLHVNRRPLLWAIDCRFSISKLSGAFKETTELNL